MRLLVSGGAGYVGSVVAAQLVAAGHDVTVIDDLSTGHRDAVPPGAAFICLAVSDKIACVLAERGIKVFGDDYPTPDGTCVRDHVHVTDLADAHLRALSACQPGRHRIYNLAMEQAPPSVR